MYNFWIAFTAAFYATTSVVESVRKAQEENSAMLLSRALQLCKDKMVSLMTFHLYSILYVTSEASH